MSFVKTSLALFVVPIALLTIAGNLNAADLAKGAHHAIVSKDVVCGAGKECVISIVLSAADGYHINKDYPTKLKAEELAGVEFLGTDAGGKNVFSKAAGDYKVDSEKQATLNMKIKVAKAGSITVSGNFKFCVCSEKECVPDAATLKIPITVK